MSGEGEGIIRWEDPPNPPRKPRKRWWAIFTELMSRPGEWALISESISPTIVSHMRRLTKGLEPSKGAPRYKVPLGRFEFTSKSIKESIKYTKKGDPYYSKAKVWARYIGPLEEENE